MKYVKITEYKFPNLDSITAESFVPDPNTNNGMYHVTCSNHPTAKYYTKNPFSRGLHFIDPPEGFAWDEECPCGFDELVVVCHD